jgi:hypothetical protein
VTALGDARAQLRARPAKAEPEPWHFPSWDDFEPHHGVLAFDATLTHCGWAYMRAWKAGIDVVAKGCINPATELDGYLGTWEKALLLSEELVRETGAFAQAADSIVVEAPAVGGHRTESSLIAGLAARMAFRDRCELWTDRERKAPWRGFYAVSATHVSSVLLGDARMRSAERKKAVRDAVIVLHNEAAGRGWNEHMRDAFATGAVHLFDEKRRRPHE